MKILVADDDELYSGLYDRMLTKWGYSFDIVNDGKEAVERAVENEGKYDICLMDIDMPYMSGYEATKLIRLKTKYFPILGVTGNISIKDKYSECGMDDYFKKPFDINEIRKKIDELTIKYETIVCNDREVIIKKEMPMNKEHAEELRELAKQGLIKMSVRGLGDHESIMVVHKNVPNKIARDFIEKKQDVVSFLDRNEDKPAMCHLYKSSCPMPLIYIHPEELTEELKKENDELNTCTAMVFKKES